MSKFGSAAGTDTEMTHKVKGCQSWCGVCVGWWVRDEAEKKWESLKQFPRGSLLFSED